VEVLSVCMPTPIGVGELADLSAVEAVIDEVRAALPSGAVVVNKSTLPVGAAELLERPDVASKPEFLREGSAVHDFLNPDRIMSAWTRRTRRARCCAVRAPRCAHGSDGLASATGPAPR